MACAKTEIAVRRVILAALATLASFGLTACLTANPDSGPAASQTSIPSGPAPSVGGPDSLLRIANAMAAQGAYSAAIPVYRRAYQKQSSPEALVGLGRALSAIGQYQEALDIFEKAANRDSGNSAAFRGQANSYIALGHADQALPLLDQALAINPGDVDVLSSRAVALDSLGRHDEAIATYEQGLAANPQHAGLRHNYGLSLALTGSDFHRAIELMKSDAAGPLATAAQRQSLALVYTLSGDDNTAARLLSIDEDTAEVESKLAYFHTIQGMPLNERFRTVLTGSVQPKRGSGDPAVRVYETDQTRRTETAARVVEESSLVAERPSAEEAAAVESRQTTAAEPSSESVKSESPYKLAAKPSASLSQDELSDIPLQMNSSGWTLQIASYRQSAQLRTGWALLKVKYSDIIGHLEPRRSEVDFGPRTTAPKGKYYRLSAGPLMSFVEAAAACRALHARGAECWIRPPQKAAGEAAGKRS